MYQYQILSWDKVVALLVVYCATLAFYRVFLHPVPSFPGPKLAAITLWYEAYYDLVHEGQYTFKIAEMHRTYGNFSTWHLFSSMSLFSNPWLIQFLSVSRANRPHQPP
ncbi:hypothetical protein diail_3340 [Diaporthe ilicicola]|nr:hypothetical protein diail_3340 [Diaporthe ilicicola]